MDLALKEVLVALLAAGFFPLPSFVFCFCGSGIFFQQSHVGDPVDSTHVKVFDKARRRLALLCLWHPHCSLQANPPSLLTEVLTFGKGQATQISPSRETTSPLWLAVEALEMQATATSNASP